MCTCCRRPQARDLRIADVGGTSDPYIKAKLAPNGDQPSKKKTKIKMHTLNPVWDDTLEWSMDDYTVGGGKFTTASTVYLWLKPAGSAPSRHGQAQ